MPSEKAVIRKIFVCYVYNLFVYVLTAYLVKQENYSYKQSKLVRLHCSSCEDIINTSLQPFTVLHKINSSGHNNIMAFEIRYYNANS